MILQPDEEEFILLMADEYERDQHRDLIPRHEVSRVMRISPERLGMIVDVLRSSDIVADLAGGLAPMLGSVMKAREIRSQREAKRQEQEEALRRPIDWVDKTAKWARQHRSTAIVIIIATCVGWSVAVLGGILGILAFFRR